MVVSVPKLSRAEFPMKPRKSAVITKILTLFALRRRRGKTAETIETAGFYVIFDPQEQPMRSLYLCCMKIRT
jgi:hypothetical protein